MNIEIRKIDSSLTPETALERGLEWYADELYGEKTPEKNNFGINAEVDIGNVIGMPRFEKTEDGYVGLYQELRTIKLPEVDWNLNPENAGERGLIWTGDCIMDPEAPDEANEEFVELSVKGYKFGEPANVNTIGNNFVGVYKPMADQGV